MRPCPNCGGDGEFALAHTFGPGEKPPRVEVWECNRCDGTGEVTVELMGTVKVTET